MTDNPYVLLSLWVQGRFTSAQSLEQALSGYGEVFDPKGKKKSHVLLRKRLKYYPAWRKLSGGSITSTTTRASKLVAVISTKKKRQLTRLARKDPTLKIVLAITIFLERRHRGAFLTFNLPSYSDQFKGIPFEVEMNTSCE